MRATGAADKAIIAFVIVLVIAQVAQFGAAQVEATSTQANDEVAALRQRIEELEKLVSKLMQTVEELEAKCNAGSAGNANGVGGLLLRRFNLLIKSTDGRGGLLRGAVLRTSLNGGMQIAQVAQGSEVQQAQPEAVQTPSQPLAAFGGAGLWQTMNPDISVIGSFAMRLGGKSPFGSYRGAMLRTVELSLQAYADPFGRLDAFVEHSPEGTHICQAELSILDPSVLRLPKGVQVRGGILLANVSKLNTIHAHEQPLADLPLLHQFFYSHPHEGNNHGDNGGSKNHTVQLLNRIIEHGGHNFHGAGARISYLIPTRSPRQAHEISIEALNAHNLTFDCGSGRPLLLGRWRSFFEITPVEKTLDLGINYGYGPNPFGGNTHLYSIDLTYRWRPIEAGLYRSLSWYNEFALARRSGTNGSKSATGFFSMIEYQLSRTLYLGARYDWASLPDSSAHGSGISFALTYYPSEFSRYRLQLNRRRYSLLGTSWDLILEATFSIGIHRPHPF